MIDIKSYFIALKATWVSRLVTGHISNWKLIPLKYFNAIGKNWLLLYSYNFHPIKNTHLRHVTVHYFSVLYNRKPYFFRIGRPDKSVFSSYCTLCKGSNSLILSSVYWSLYKWWNIQ